MGVPHLFSLFYNEINKNDECSVKGAMGMEKKLTCEELKRAATLAKERGIIKAMPVVIPKNDKYDRINIAKQRTWERLGIWLD